MKKLVNTITFTAAICTAPLLQAEPMDSAEESETPATVVCIAAANDAFSTLVAAVKAADLADALMGEGPFTVFAPTNDAFAALPEGTVDNLLKPENKDQLVAILKYHVVPGAVYSYDLQSGAVETLNGANVNISVTEDGVTVNGANVTTADLEAGNGVVHVIDAVILPPQ